MNIGGQLESLFARTAESAANATLRLDEASGERLAALEGRAVQIESTFPKQTWSVRVSDARIEVQAGRIDAADAVIKGTAQDLAAWFVMPHSRAAERVQIAGDAALLVELAGLFRALAPREWAVPVTRNDLLGAVEAASAVARSAAEGIADAWREATTARFVTRDRANDFAAGIADLRRAIETLAARVETLESREPGAHVGDGSSTAAATKEKEADPDAETPQPSDPQA